jgi:hypothetical protein
MDMKVDIGYISGEPYHCVNPMPTWDATRFVRWMGWQAWCEKQFGTTPADGVWTPGQRWYVNNEKLWFRSESDMLMFILRWS